MASFLGTRRRHIDFLTIAIAVLGLTLDACLRGLLLLADPSRRR
ncbi:MAG: hypothetical protein ACRDOU_12700 [Streptosporangiaceae bacterium]